MGTLYVDTLEPEGGTTTLTVGETGQNTVVGGNTIKLNTLKDAGANTIFTSDGSGNLSSVNSGFGSDMKLLSSQTASDSSSIAFTGLMSATYGEYIFKCYNMVPATDDVMFSFQVNASGESGYNEVHTSTVFRTYNNTAGTSAALVYDSESDAAQGTGYQILNRDAGNVGSECSFTELHLFNPASTTYVKNFYTRGNMYTEHGYSTQHFAGGYFNITAAIVDIQFQYNTGNITTGTIKMFGMK